MNERYESTLPYIAFWCVIALFIWCEHHQYMSGHNTYLWSHQTDAEKKIAKSNSGECK